MWFFFQKRRELGVIAPDPKDIRDYQLAEVQPEIVKLPEEFDLRDKMTSVQRQFWGTCTSHAVDGLKEFLDKREYGKEIKLSQRFIYYNTKKISGLWSIQGDYVRNALKSVVKYGACLEKTFPDKRMLTWQEYVNKEPSEQAYKEAEKYKGKTYWAVGRTLEDFRQAIYQQKAPVVFSMMWYGSYYRPAKDGRLALPDKKRGGHALACVGWEREKLWVRNSHGVGWGLNGYFYIPFEEFQKHDIWNAYVLLDLERPENLTGWVAGKYLDKVLKFSSGDLVKINGDGLRLRETPGTSSKILASLKMNQEAVIIEDKDNGTRVNNYRWFKIKVGNN